jgi:hypothetical protein
MLPPPIKPTKRTQAYIPWMRATHNGRRSPSNPPCSECGTVMTDDQVAEYRGSSSRVRAEGHPTRNARSLLADQSAVH